MDEKFSYSKISTYDGCGFKFKLQYRDGHYIFADSIATLFGTAIHETEEAIAKAIQAGEEIDYIKIKNELILKLSTIENRFPIEYVSADKSGKTYREKAYNYLENSIYNLEKFMHAHENYEIVGIEQKFNFRYDDEHTFTGAIDRVFHDTKTNTYLIQDIKSWSVPAKDGELTTPLQFVVYTLAAKELWNAEPEQISCQYYLPLVDGGFTQNGGTKGYINRGKTKLNKLFTAIASDDYAPKPTALCNYCNFCMTNPDAPEESKYLCPYFSLWNRETRDRNDFRRHENEWQGLEKHELILEAFHKKYNIN